MLEQSKPNFFVAQEEISGNCEVWAEDGFLVDGVDAVIDRLVRSGECYRLAFP
jgi:hypothetical protein